MEYAIDLRYDSPSPLGIDPDTDLDMYTEDYIRPFEHLQPANPETLVPVLPPEIIDHIISFLWDEPATLCCCALTCRSWRHASQNNMLHSITLRSHSGFQSFVRHVLHDPHRKEYLHLVHHLTVWDMHHSRPSLHAIPHHIAGYLTQLKTITFSFSQQFAPHPSFYAVLHGFTSVHSLILRRCAFNRLRDLTMLISAFPHLDELHVDASCRDCAIMPKGSRVPGPQLKVLHLSAGLMYINALCAWLCRTRSSTSITHLHIDSVLELNADSNGVRQLIPLLGGSLIHLDTFCFKSFGEHPKSPSSAEVPTLAHNTNLQFLRLGTSRGLKMVDWMRIARIVSQVVSRLRCLEILSEEYRFYEEKPERRNGMAAIDAHLCRENFGDLEQVKFLLHLYRDVGTRVMGREIDLLHAHELMDERELLRDRVVRDIQQCLPRLHARGILSIDVRYLSPFSRSKENPYGPVEWI